ncbi:MAG: ZIP family metal transporter [Thermodesulfovibrionales bacterium]|nr:ZIP family metal transporter [Thermodesulfovibrionales bacterium]
MDFFTELSPLMQTLIATSFTYLLTAVGASGVFFVKEIKEKLLDGMLGFAAGVMIAASYWSLLEPSIEISEKLGSSRWFPPLTGFILGALSMRLLDALLPHLHPGFPSEATEGIKTKWKRTTLFVFAVTLHNIPEGLAVGVAFGALKEGIASATLPGAIALAIGIGIQNLPEGLAISMPLRREGFSRLKGFFYGQLSGMVEPIAGLIGVLAVSTSLQILPYALSFAAGAMIYIVIEELIPESQRKGNTDIATMGAITGFAIMMVLDVGLKS